MRKKWTQSEIGLLLDKNKSFMEIYLEIPYRSPSTIRTKSKKLGIRNKDRGNAEERWLRTSQNYKDLLEDKEFCSIIDGELLGDGCVQQSREGYFSFTYSTVNKEYIEYLHKYIANKTNSRSSVYKYEKNKPHFINGKKVVGKQSYGFAVSHKIFKFFRKRWYPNGKKIVPSDLELNPLVCRHWHIGDGCIYNQSTLEIVLYTNCFSKEHVEILISKLEEKKILSRLNVANKKKEAYVIRMSKENVIKFLKYCGDCPTKSYEYKWDVGKYSIIYRKCLNCNTLFHFFGKESYKRKHCCHECQIAYKKRKYHEKKYPQHISRCKKCDKLFSFCARSSDLRKFCSVECRTLFFRRRDREYMQRYHRRNLNFFEKECIVCGQRFEFWAKKENYKKFCRKKCKNACRN